MPISKLDAVYDRIRADRNFDHLRNPGIKLVKGIGLTERPAVMILGEAPGATENVRGRPFCGPSGRVLDGLMEAAGLRTKERVEYAAAGEVTIWVANTWITNVIKYHPLGNRTPSSAEIAQSKRHVGAEWNAIGRPRVIVGVGNVPKSCIIPHVIGGISNLVGKTFPLRDGATTFVPMFHPAYGLRRQSMRPMMEEHWKWLGVWLVKEGVIDEFGKPE
jgi:uracil-DNA glycosylase